MPCSHIGGISVRAWLVMAEAKATSSTGAWITARLRQYGGRKGGSNNCLTDFDGHSSPWGPAARLGFGPRLHSPFHAENTGSALSTTSDASTCLVRIILLRHASDLPPAAVEAGLVRPFERLPGGAEVCGCGWRSRLVVRMGHGQVNNVVRRRSGRSCNH